jgi:hypothetical protein
MGELDGALVTGQGQGMDMGWVYPSNKKTYGQAIAKGRVSEGASFSARASDELVDSHASQLFSKPDHIFVAVVLLAYMFSHRLPRLVVAGYHIVVYLVALGDCAQFCR